MQDERPPILHIDIEHPEVNDVEIYRNGVRLWNVVECSVLGCWARQRKGPFIVKVYGQFEIRRKK